MHAACRQTDTTRIPHIHPKLLVYGGLGQRVSPLMSPFARAKPKVLQFDVCDQPITASFIVPHLVRNTLKKSCLTGCHNWRAALKYTGWNPASSSETGRAARAVQNRLESGLKFKDRESAVQRDSSTGIHSCLKSCSHPSTVLISPPEPPPPVHTSPRRPSWLVFIPFDRA